MARLLTPPLRYGTAHGICVYPMRGEAFVRIASSLTGKQVKTAPEFKNTMAWAEWLKVASRLGGAVYSMLAPYRRKHKRYKKLTGMAMRLLRAGNTEGETVVELMLSIQFRKKKRTAQKTVQQEATPVAPFSRQISA